MYHRRAQTFSSGGAHLKLGPTIILKAIIAIANIYIYIYIKYIKNNLFLFYSL